MPFFFFSLEAVRAQRGATTRTGRRKSHPQQQSPSSKVPAAKSQRLSRERKKVTKVSPGHSFPLIVEFFSGNRSWTLPSPVAASAVCSHQPSAISHRTRRGPRRVTLWRAAVPWRTRSAHVVTQADLGRFPEAIALSLFGPVCLAQFPCFFPSLPSFPQVPFSSRVDRHGCHFFAPSPRPTGPPAVPAFSSFSIVFVAPVVFSWLQRAGGQGKGEVGKVKLQSRSCKVEVAEWTTSTASKSSCFAQSGSSDFLLLLRIRSCNSMLF